MLHCNKISVHKHTNSFKEVMQTQLINQWSEFSRKTFESLSELGQISSRFVEQLSRQQLSVLNATVEATSRGTQLIRETYGYGKLLENQSTAAAEYNKRVLTIARQTANILTEARDDLSSWAERGVKNVERGVEVAGRAAERTVQWGAEQAEDGAERVRTTTRTAQGAVQRAAATSVNGATQRAAAKSTNGAKRKAAKKKSA
jgi:hypothetical protein